MEELTSILWNLWRRRNENVFKNILINPKVVLHRVNQIKKDIAEFQNISDAHANSNMRRNVTWVFPPSSFYKINWEMAIDKKTLQTRNWHSCKR